MSLQAAMYSIASQTDDADIRALIAAETMPGWVRLSFQREPDYLAYAGMGAEHHAIIARDNRSGSATGICALTRRMGFFEGEPRLIGYLAELRLAAGRGLPRVRIIKEGFSALRCMLHDPAVTPFYLTAILEDNRPAQRLLEAGVAGLPAYHFLCGLTTYAISTQSCRYDGIVPQHVMISQGQQSDMPELEDFLCRQMARFHLATQWTREKISACPGLNIEDFLLARCEGQLIGCLALWDQRTFRQTVIRNYASPISFFRPLINLAARITQQPCLPPTGKVISQAFISHLAVSDDNWPVARSLVEAARAEARKRSIDILLLGLCDTHPLQLHFSTERASRRYRSRLYIVFWPEDAGQVSMSRTRPVHVEVALL